MASKTTVTCDSCGLEKSDIVHYQISIHPVKNTQPYREVDVSPDLCDDCIRKIEKRIQENLPGITIR